MKMGRKMERVRRLLKLDEIYRSGVIGDGVNIAVIDSGAYLHPDYRDRIIGFVDVLNHNHICYDNNGHGTHVAGIIAGNGKLSEGKYRGVAPGSKILCLKVLNQLGQGKVQHMVAAINWVIDNRYKYNIRIINISVGGPVESEDDEDSILVKAVEKAWDSGIVVVAAAGNNGPTPYTITTPGISKKIITVGASDMKELSNVSGRGPTLSCIQKPDIIAPSHQIISCKAYKNYRYMSIQDVYEAKSGTSMSTPIVSGAISLLLQVRPDFTPKDVKMRLRDTVKSVGLPRNQQGWGMVDIQKLINF